MAPLRFSRLESGVVPARGDGRRRAPRDAALVLPDPAIRRAARAGARHRAATTSITCPDRNRSTRAARKLQAGLTRLLKGMKRVAMEYSPNCAIPYVSRVDAGTIELIRGARRRRRLVRRSDSAVRGALERRGDRHASGRVGKAVSHQGSGVRRGRAPAARRRRDHRVRHPAEDGRLVQGRRADRATRRRASRPRRTPAIRITSRRQPQHRADPQGRARAARSVGQARERPARSTPTSRGSDSPARPCPTRWPGRSARSAAPATRRSSIVQDAARGRPRSPRLRSRTSAARKVLIDGRLRRRDPASHRSQPRRKRARQRRAPRRLRDARRAAPAARQRLHHRTWAVFQGFRRPDRDQHGLGGRTDRK